MTDSAASPTDDQFTVWTAALLADYLPVATVVRWADEQILARDELPAWLLDLALVSSPGKAARLLYEARDEQANATQQRGSLRGQAEGALILGFLFLRYERNEFTQREFLLAAGSRADGMDCGCDCEEFYQLLNELDGQRAAASVGRPWAERYDEHFSPFAELARRCALMLPASR